MICQHLFISPHIFGSLRDQGQWLEYNKFGKSAKKLRFFQSNEAHFFAILYVPHIEVADIFILSSMSASGGLC